MLIIQVCRLLKFLNMPATYYAVAKGLKPGIYGSWDECKAQIHEFSGAVFKKFPSQEAAQTFIREKTSSSKEKVNSTNEKTTSTKKNKKSTQNLEIVPYPTRELPCIHVPVKQKFSAKRSKLVDISEIPSAKRTKLIDISEIPSSTSSVKKSSSGFMIDSDGYVNVYTDGACSSNGYKNAIAGIGVWFGEDHPLNVSALVVGRQTNNNAEIQAVTMAARKAKEAGVKKLKIITDSKFLITCITQWMPNWKKNGWKTAKKDPVLNKVELLEMEEALKSLTIAWKHVNGHVGIHGNEMADKLAREGCKKV
ncbi:ribonuclease H1 [Lasioglossum baleicum]|uniref:ribonuclease H1 n=1 Tax=Lasioglossum baleicum TaxID=434251 RepID=UPI003FCD3626